MILAQLSDPHVGGPDDPDGALAAAVDVVLALDRAPDAVLVSGDLANAASDEEYARVAERLSALPMPVHVLPGNHDRRAALHAHFPLGGGDGDGPYRYVAGCGGLRLVVCDTLREGHDDGALGEEQLAWLAARLDETADVPTIVAMHHPPVRIGMPSLDRIGLPDGDRHALAELLAARPQAVRVVTGHVHLAALATVGGCPVVTSPSVWLQACLEFAEKPLELVPRPPALLLHVLVDGELVTHVQPVG